MAEETALATNKTGLLRGVKDSKMGTLVVTSERIIFTDTKFAGRAAGGVLGVVIADKLQKRHEDGGPDARPAARADYRARP